MFKKVLKVNTIERALIAAQEVFKPLGLKPGQIHLRMNDTSLTTKSCPSGGSRHNVIIGNAIRVACENAIDNACGVHIRHLPAYPEKILAALSRLRRPSLLLMHLPRVMSARL
ncbi:MAG: molybdopterin-dependent oxidoreductase [Geobacteraceae bacterium]|nr:molybdopterin-dependent oxidoreductase [Geobacteraceae bacterium]